MTAKECISHVVDCEECGAETVVVIIYKPAFKDFTPVCQFCGVKPADAS